MIKLKELRKTHNLTQTALADKLGTTQQTIQRWETGKTSIPSKILKDLAVIFNCSIDSILGISKAYTSLYPRAFVTSSETKNHEKIITHYGGVTLTVKGILEDIDYPIDDEAAKAILWYLRSPGDDFHPSSWMHFETMDNHILFVNLKALKIAHVYTDDYHAAPTFYHPEVYRVLTDWDEINPDLKASEIADFFDTSETFIKIIKNITQQYGNEQENWDSWGHFHYIKIYWIDGEQTSHYLDEKLYSKLDELRTASEDPGVYLEAEQGTRFLQEEDEGGYIDFLNLDHIALIEVPAIRYWQIYCEDDPDSLDIRELSPYMPHKNSNQQIEIESNEKTS